MYSALIFISPYQLPALIAATRGTKTRVLQTSKLSTVLAEFYTFHAVDPFNRRLVNLASMRYSERLEERIDKTMVHGTLWNECRGSGSASRKNEPRNFIYFQRPESTGSNVTLCLRHSIYIRIFLIRRYLKTHAIQAPIGAVGYSIF